MAWDVISNNNNFEFSCSLTLLDAISAGEDIKDCSILIFSNLANRTFKILKIQHTTCRTDYLYSTPKCNILFGVMIFVMLKADSIALYVFF